MIHTLFVATHVLISATSFLVMFAGLYSMLTKNLESLKKRSNLLLYFIIGSATTGVGLIFAGAPLGKTCVTLMSYLLVSLGIYAVEQRSIKKTGCPYLDGQQ